MPESPEHEYLKFAFNDVLREFSRLDLYGFTETDRRRFDLSSLLERDWTRPLVGQVLWNHSGGIEKDLRTLLTDDESEIKVYVARDRLRHHAIIGDVLDDYRRAGKFPDTFRLKLFWVPPDFDADAEAQRLVVSEFLKVRIVEDLLFNVVFGDLSPANVQILLSPVGYSGLTLTILHAYAVNGFLSNSELARRLGVGPATVRLRIAVLQGVGAIYDDVADSQFHVTTRGRVLLEIAARLYAELTLESVSPELEFVLRKLQCPPLTHAQLAEDRAIISQSRYVELVRELRGAVRHFGVDWSVHRYGFRRDPNRPAG